MSRAHKHFGRKNRTRVSGRPRSDGGLRGCGNVGMLFGEAHAVVADPQGRFAGLSLELLHVAFAGLSEAVQRGEDAHSGLANRHARQYTRKSRVRSIHPEEPPPSFLPDRMQYQLATGVASVPPSLEYI
jgi:hypothetical protein